MTWLVFFRFIGSLQWFLRFYHYYIYEIVDATTFDYANIDTTDIRNLTGLVETGKAYWSAPAIVNYYYKDIKTSIVTYGQ